MDRPVVILNKPRGITSHKACKKVQTLTGAYKAGHAGTLDPEAEGVLIVCLNEATRITPYLSDLDKEYIATGLLGITTDSHDITGEVLEKKDPSGIAETDIREVLRETKGEILQVPPPYSAVRKGGERLYRLARKGIKVELPPRKVTIYEIELIRFNPPEFVIRVVCSKGTYVRTLIHDIGKSLGSGATLKALERTSVGPFTIEQACSFEELREGICRLLSIDEALAHLPALKLKPSQFRLARYGTGFKAETRYPAGTVLRLQEPHQNRCFAIGLVRDTGEIKVEKVFIR